jgi:hypothetical protein
MAFTFVPLLIAFPKLSTGQMAQYLGALLIGYDGGLNLLARRIHKWTSGNTDGAAPTDGPEMPLGNSEGSESGRHP